MTSTDARNPATKHSTCTSGWAGMRERLTARRASRARWAQLQRDLATYTRSTDLDDLYATLDRYDDSDTGAIRDILSLQGARAA